MNEISRFVAGSIAFALSGAALGSDDPTSCLSAEQRSELFRRVAVVMAAPMMEAMHTRSAAVSAHSAAKNALERCELRRGETLQPDQCSTERESLLRAQTALGTAKMQTPQERAERLANTKAQVEAIRTEYPACGAAIDR